MRQTISQLQYQDESYVLVMYKEHDLIFTVEIPGRPFVKKNTQRIVGFGSRKRAIYSPKYVAWSRVAQLCINKAVAKSDTHHPIKEEIILKVTFHFKNKASIPDLSNLYEGIQDVLQTAGVIENDKQIIGHDGSRRIIDGTERTIVQLLLA